MNTPAIPHLPGPLAAVTPQGVAAWLTTLGVGEGVAEASGLLVTIVVLYAAVMLPFACLAALFGWSRGVGPLRGFGCGLVFGLAGVALVRGMLPGWGPEMSARRGGAGGEHRGGASARVGRRTAQRTRRGGSVGSPGSGLPQGSVRGIVSFASVACVSPFTQGWPSAHGTGMPFSGSRVYAGNASRW